MLSFDRHLTCLSSSPLLLLLVTGLLGLIALIYRHWALNRSIKGPRHWPLLGALVETISTLDRHHDWITDYARQFKTFEMTVGLFASQRRLIYTTDPANIEYFLKTNFDNYYKGTVTYDIQYELLGEGIFNSDGENWKQQRKIASFQFANNVLRHRSIKCFRKIAIKMASLLADKIASEDNQVNMSDLFMRLTFDSICEVGFGVEMGTLSTSMPIVPFARAFDSVNLITSMRFFNPLWKVQRLLNVGMEAKLKKDIQLLNEFTKTLIQRRREEIDNKTSNGMEYSDLLSRFLTMDKESTIDDSDKRLRDFIINFVIAGRDTTSIALSWFLYLVSHQPQVQTKLLQELYGVGQNKKEQITHHVKDHHHQHQCCCKECIETYGATLDFESLARMHYLHATLCETLRLYPVVPEDGRTAYRHDILPDGTQVNPGNTVLFIPYAMGRMEELWGADALDFKPERWIKDGVFEPQSPYKFSAFQAGPRICLGRDFAFLQMKMVAAILLRFFKFHVVPGHVVKYMMTLTLSMSKGLEMFVEYR